MEPLEQVTVLMTLMKRLVQVMDHERAILKSLRLEALASLEPHVRAQLHDAMCGFQESVTVNLHALSTAREMVDRVLCNISESLTRATRTLTSAAPGQTGDPEPRGQVISIAFDRRL